MKDTRSVVSKPEWGLLRQGTVFSGAIAEGYAGCEVFGLVITAECDLAHDKALVINYVPVVRLSDWMVREFAFRVARRVEAQTLGQFRELLRAEGLNPAVLTTEPIDIVIEKLLAPVAKGKKVVDRAAQLAAALALCRRAREEAPVDLSILAALRSVDRKGHDNLLDELMKCEMAGTYFLATVAPGASHDGYVALFRQVYHIPQPIAVQLAGGIDLEKVNADTLKGMLDAGAATFAMPIGQVTPPFLQHLMQMFGLLFTRIGVPDIAPVYTTLMRQRCAGET